MTLKAPAFHKFVSFAAVFALGFVASCGLPTQQEQSASVQTVNLPHTKAKWQSIGNCWAYAFASWAESIALGGIGETVDLSETYITMRHYQDQLLQGVQGELQTGGSFEVASRITLNYGYMLEGDFVADEANATFSKVQKAATAYLNQSIKSGLLSKNRSAATVRSELEAAFGFKTADLSSKIKKASELALVKNLDGSVAQTLESAIRNWTTARWPKDWASSSQKLPYWSGSFTPSQETLLQRVKKALNDGHPVVMDWFVDFNALTSKGEFSGEALKAKGSGRQGYHSVVIEDYVVEGVNPATGEKFEVGEGEATPEMKELALKYGKIKYFVIKNSWGGLERTDRTSYVRDGVGGYHKLDADYLFAWLTQTDEKTGEVTGSDTALGRFVLPVGY